MKIVDIFSIAINLSTWLITYVISITFIQIDWNVIERSVIK